MIFPTKPKIYRALVSDTTFAHALISYKLNLNRSIEGEIMLSFKCEDDGMKCDFKATAETRDKLMGKIVVHAREAHNMKNIPHDFMAKVKKAIKE